MGHKHTKYKAPSPPLEPSTHKLNKQKNPRKLVFLLLPKNHRTIFANCLPTCSPKITTSRTLELVKQDAATFSKNQQELPPQEQGSAQGEPTSNITNKGEQQAWPIIVKRVVVQAPELKLYTPCQRCLTKRSKRRRKSTEFEDRGGETKRCRWWRGIDQRGGMGQRGRMSQRLWTKGGMGV